MALDDTPIDLDALPVVVAGPIVRRTSRTSVSVWLALTQPDEVVLTITDPSTGTATTAAAVPTRVGVRLWMTVVSAAAPDGAFVPGVTYLYDVVAAAGAARPIDLTADALPDLTLPNLTLPSFLGPPDDVHDLGLLHASCRKPHGGGHDGLALADAIIAERATGGDARPPHLLLLSGDQIYADEVGHPLAVRINRVATDLIGIDESDVFGPTPKIGDRKATTNGFGFTTGSGSNHLWTYGEFVAMYLLAWSPVLWPVELEPFPADDLVQATELAEGLEADSWNRDLGNVGRFRSALPAVARVLANVPSLMTLDDHEVTDDWNLDLAWATTVYADPTARRVVANGLLAYALCQHWGNVPARFATAGSPESALLDVMASAAAAPSSPALAASTLIGMPPTSFPEPPPAVALRDPSDPGSITYATTLDDTDGWPVRIVLLDERTTRELIRPDDQAARISLAGLEAQLPAPTAAAPLTVVVAAAPIFGSDLVEDVIQPTADLLPGGGQFADFESWSAVVENHQDLLRRLAEHHPVVVLSGDVHYGFTARVERDDAGTATAVAQLTGSAAKNTEIKNAAISLFSELILRLGLERTRAVAGYAELAPADRQRFEVPPPDGTVLAWDDAVDVLLGRIARDAVASPTAMPLPVAEAYGLPDPDWSYVVHPVDDPESDYQAPAVDPPWDGWDPDKSLTMAAGLQEAALHRMARMFIGLPQLSLVGFRSDGGSLIVEHGVLAAVGQDDGQVPGTGTPVVHQVTTEVALT